MSAFQQEASPFANKPRLTFETVLPLWERKGLRVQRSSFPTSLLSPSSREERILCWDSKYRVWKALDLIGQRIAKPHPLLSTSQQVQKVSTKDKQRVKFLPARRPRPQVGSRLRACPPTRAQQSKMAIKKSRQGTHLGKNSWVADIVPAEGTTLSFRRRQRRVRIGDGTAWHRVYVTLPCRIRFYALSFSSQLRLLKEVIGGEFYVRSALC